MTDVDNWTVNLVGQAKKFDKTLSQQAAESFLLLLKELKNDGPYRANWPNYTKMTEDDYHCHIKKGRPTYVVCWKIYDKKYKIIEVYYAGTHEKAPY
jgi:hypothetical protein